MDRLKKQHISRDEQASEKAQLLNEIKRGLMEVKEIREGKAKAYVMADLLNGD